MFTPHLPVDLDRCLRDVRALRAFHQDACPEVPECGQARVERAAGGPGAGSVHAPGGGAAGQGGENIVMNRLGLVSQDHHRRTGALVVTLGLASLVNAQSDHKASLRCADLGFVEYVRTEERMAGLKPYSIKELFFELAPRGRGDDDSPHWPIEKAPKSSRNKNS